MNITLGKMLSKEEFASFFRTHQVQDVKTDSIFDFVFIFSDGTEIVFSSMEGHATSIVVHKLPHKHLY